MQKAGKRKTKKHMAQLVSAPGVVIIARNCSMKLGRLIAKVAKRTAFTIATLRYRMKSGLMMAAAITDGSDEAVSIMR